MIDLTGKKFGRLTVLNKAGSGKNKSLLWNCVCDCGREVVIDGLYLRSGDTKSCGCYRKECASKRMSTHKMSKTRLYRVWAGVKNRCYNENASNYKYYGAKGITMCDEWKDSFESFRNWAIASGYNENARPQECTLDRIDNNSGYSPNNCRWANHQEQCNNQSSNKIIAFNGESHSMSEWADVIGMEYTTLRARIRRGMSISEALTKPVRSRS